MSTFTFHTLSTCIAMKLLFIIKYILYIEYFNTATSLFSHCFKVLRINFHQSKVLTRHCVDLWLLFTTRYIFGEKRCLKIRV